MKRMLLLVAALAFGTGAGAQSSAEANAGLEFNFGSPGARSLGLGGAFVALADDATAVFINPAGLTQVAKAEVAVEGRRFTYTNVFTAGGRVAGTPTMRGIDTVSGLIEGQQRESIGAVSFASFVYPGDRWSVALYRHELANFRLSTRAEGVLLERIQLNKPATVRTFPSKNNLDLRIVSYGASFARRFGERLSLGATVVTHQFELDSITQRFDYTRAGLTAPADYQTVFSTDTQHGRDSKFAVHAGVLWHATDDLRFGLSFQHGNRFNVQVDSSAAADTPKSGGFLVPTVLRAGTAYTFPSSTTVSLEVDRIRYSRLTERFVLLHGEPDRYRAQDGTEIHLGIQHLLTPDWLLDVIRYPVVLSAGVWRDPDHRIWYTDETNPQSFLFRRGEDEYHYSLGAALAAGETYEIGVAYDHSRRQQTASASLIVRF